MGYFIPSLNISLSASHYVAWCEMNLSTFKILGAQRITGTIYCLAIPCRFQECEEIGGCGRTHSFLSLSTLCGYIKLSITGKYMSISK